MRKVLVIALGALVLAGCVHHDGRYRGAGYGHGGYHHGHNAGWQQAPWRPAYRRAHDGDHWRWRERRRDRHAWYR